MTVSACLLLPPEYERPVACRPRISLSLHVPLASSHAFGHSAFTRHSRCQEGKHKGPFLSAGRKPKEDSLGQVTPHKQSIASSRLVKLSL